MKVVDALWELRNLGKKTIEITLEEADFQKSPKDICNLINQIKDQYQSEYTVVKVGCGNPWFGSEIVKHGFFHIETQFHIKATKKDIETAAKRYGHFFKNTTMQKVTDKESQDHILSEIRKGIFFTDRIALDPEFGIEIANKRYANWTEDEIKRGSTLAYIIADGKKIGFSLRRHEGFSAFGLLAGLFNDYKNLNLGGNIFFTELYEDTKNGYKNFYGDVSSNNLTALRLNENFGYRIEKIYEVHIKHDKY